MVNLITRSDIENFLQITLPTGFFDSYVTEICNDAHAQLLGETNRTTFTGNASTRAKRAELYIAIYNILSADKELSNSAISSISEDGKSITYSNSISPETYLNMAKKIIADLRLNGSQDYGIRQGVYTSTNVNMLYGDDEDPDD